MVNLMLRWFGCGVVLCCAAVFAGTPGDAPKLWALKPLVRPDVPAGLTASPNPIDAFVAAQYKAQGLTPIGPADKRSLLRRVYLDLIGLPPTPAEQDAFLQDQTPDAYEKVVDRLLASPQHGVRYGRHWLDVLRYADVEERHDRRPGYLHVARLGHQRPQQRHPLRSFRAHAIDRLSHQRPHDMSDTGYRSRIQPRPDDLFALGFLARGAVLRDGKDAQELPIAAVETVSTAFMGLTVGCAKCHDHLYDPIKQRDFYAMKALFDPLVLKKVILATPAKLIANGKAIGELDKKRTAIQRPLEDLIAPFKKKLYDERSPCCPTTSGPSF